MAIQFLDRAGAYTLTVGTGTMTLDRAMPDYQNFDGITTGSQVEYIIQDGAFAWEAGIGVYTAGTPGTLTRGTTASSASGATLSLSGAAIVICQPVALWLNSMSTVGGILQIDTKNGINGGPITASSGTLTADWNGGAVNTIGTGMTVAAGTITADWQLGPVDAIGTGISIHASTIDVDWHGGPVTIATDGVHVSKGTLFADWNAGAVSAIGTGLTAAAGTLTPEWQAGTVTATGANLTNTKGTLDAVPPEWTAGTVTAIGTNLTNTKGTLDGIAAEWTAGAVTTIGANLTNTKGTLASTDTNIWNAGTVTDIGTGLTLASGTITSDWQVGSATTIGTGLTLATGTMSATGVFPSVYVSDAAGTGRAVDFQTAGSNRWSLGATSAAEGGGNAGSDLALDSWTDAGTPLTTLLTITRSTGAVNLLGTILTVAKLPTKDPATKDGAVWIDTTAGNALKVSL